MRRHIDKIEGFNYERGYVYNFNFHLVWCTKYRHAIFTTNALRNEMKTLLQQIANDNDIMINEIEVMPEHIHLMLSCKPKKAPSDVVKALKGGSARLFFMQHENIKNSKFWGGHLWAPSYCMSTVGNMSKEVVKRYIQNQMHK